MQLTTKGWQQLTQHFLKNRAYGEIWGKDTTRYVGGTYNGYAFSFAEDINNKGQILGLTEDERYLIWEDGTTTDITFEPEFSNGAAELGYMSDLNDVGEVTGIVIEFSGAACEPEGEGPDCRDDGVDYTGFILNTRL